MQENRPICFTSLTPPPLFFQLLYVSYIFPYSGLLPYSLGVLEVRKAPMSIAVLAAQ